MKIKSLEWSKNKADGIYGSYELTETSEGFNILFTPWSGVNCSFGPFKTEAIAKDFAFCDHIRFILPYLEEE